MFFLKPRANTIPSVPCCFCFNVLLSSCLLHASCRQNVASSSKHDPICAMSVGSVKVLCVFFLSLVQTRSHLCHVGSVYSSHLVAKRGTLEQERTSLYHVRFSHSVVSIFLNPWARKIPSVPCRFSVLLPSCLLHPSRGQAWRPRARTNQSLPSGFSQSLVCVFLKPRASTIPSVSCRFTVLLPSCWLHASRGQNVASSSKHDPICAMSVGLVKVLCVFFFSLVQTRSHQCHVGTVCSSHLVCSTHLVDKRGAAEQERTSPFHVGSVKVFCETGWVSWQLARFWKLASDKCLGEKLKICSLQLAVGKALGVGEGNKSHL